MATKIMGQAQAGVSQLRAYLLSVNPGVPASVLNMLQYYISEGVAEGVRGDIAFAQSCLETGNFTFAGSAVRLSQNNFAGIGVTSNGMRGHSWDTPQLGIRAQIQHLKAYACDQPLNGTCVDPRFTYIKRGSTPYVEWLGIQENPSGAGWAAGRDYGTKILSILSKILEMSGESEEKSMNIFVCVGHADYGGGVISSADGTKYGGVNEYRYNKALAPYVVKWLKAAGHKATLCIAPDGKLHSLNEEVAYFIGEEHKQNYDLAVQLHLNAFNAQAYGAEAYAYNEAGLKVADTICKKLGTIWHNRGPQIKPGLYWTRKTNAKAVLIESFFCDNVSDYAKAKKLGYDAHGKLIAEGIIGKDIAGQMEEPVDVIKPKSTCSITSDITLQFPQISKGCTGVAVKMLQVMLGVDADGVFGDATDKAFKAFQGNTGQIVDGICGKNGWTAVAEHMRANTFK